MAKTVAIIGAGAAGLISAKIAGDHELVPTVFEQAHEAGGIWREKDGFCWERLRANISTWSTCFTDAPWPQAAPEFPDVHALRGYLRDYATRHDITPLLNCAVTALSPVGHRWRVESALGEAREFDFAIVAGGVFARPHIPFDCGTFAGAVLHSSGYRKPVAGTAVAVIGLSFSGAEIAAELADAGADVSLIFRRPMWILPRYAGSLPLDLTSYIRKAPVPARQRNENIEKAFGNPGACHPELAVPVTDDPPYVLVSDTFLKAVAGGGIRVIKAGVDRITGHHVELNNGARVRADTVIMCTGYRPNLDVLDPASQNTLRYDPTDPSLPIIADKAVLHPELPGLAFVGMYKGPYFGVMELQARWACGAFVGIAAPANLANVLAEANTRAMSPPPQFPHGDYVSFADTLAKVVGCGPDIADPRVAGLPVTPPQYRLRGPHATRDQAERELARLRDRLRS